jgi:hypothetical protein
MGWTDSSVIRARRLRDASWNSVDGEAGSAVIAALIDHQRHGITLELVGERTPRPHRLSLHH